MIGVDDPGTHDSYGGGGISSRDQNGGNCFFTRYYIAATKHVKLDNLGILGVHLAWVLDRPATWEHHNRPAIGGNFRLGLPAQESCNVGFEYSFWKDYINAVVELNRCKYFSGGIVFKVHLK